MNTGSFQTIKMPSHLKYTSFFITKQFHAFPDLKKSASENIVKQEGHDGPEIAHLSLLTKHAPSSFPVT